MPAQKYDEIYRVLRAKILGGEYPAQNAIPTESVLTGEFGCSRNTVRRAIRMLADDGLVQSVHGKGVIVISREENVGDDTPPGVIESLKEYAERIEKTYASKVLFFAQETIDRETAERTGYREGDSVWHVKRVRCINGEAVRIDDSLYLASLVRDLTPEICEESVYGYIESGLHERIVTSLREFTIRKADENDRIYMDIGDYGCVAFAEIKTYNLDGTMFEFTEAHCRPDGFVIRTQARRYRPL